MFFAFSTLAHSRGALFGAALANYLLTRLRNGNPVNLTREEFRHCVLSFSQFGKDLIVHQILTSRSIQRGTYVDVGAYHPAMFSNTLLLWKAGFVGVIIDMNPGKVRAFERARPRDWNVCAAVANGNYSYESVNTGDTTEAIRLVEGDERSMRTGRLDDILTASPYASKPVVYLNIDCEGHDLNVLQSLALATYRPTVITIEALNADAGEATVQYLRDAGYDWHGLAGLTHIFVRRKDARP